MLNDFTLSLINGVLKEQEEKFRAEGLSDSEIEDKISEFDIEDALIDKIETGIAEEVELIENTMFERVLEERAHTAQFMAQNEQIWGKGFVASEAMYLFSLESVEAYAASFTKEQIPDRQFQFVALHAIHGRACQQYLEILSLLKSGFADGAYARWRSLYELSVIAKFISKAGEDVAKAYCEDATKDDNYHDWAKKYPDFAKYKHVKFSQIKDICNTDSDIENSQYKLSNKVVHGSPQGTFGRLSNGPGMESFVPVGPSVYELAAPAVNSAIALSIISTCFFKVIPTADGLVYMRTIQKWTWVISKYYTEIEAAYFGKPDDIETPSNSTK